jgi:hypothetical protein
VGSVLDGGGALQWAKTEPLAKMERQEHGGYESKFDFNLGVQYL